MGKHIIIGGGTGTVGQDLVRNLRAAGHTVQVLTRRKALASQSDDYLHWDLVTSIIDERLTRADVVINLAGSGIAEGRWTRKNKAEIIESRTLSNELLIETLSERSIHLERFIGASAIGYYGDADDKILSEEDDVVTDEFLSQVCVAWEAAMQPATQISDKLCIIRIGTVLSPSGGALEKMDQTIPMGIASYIGNGQQIMSWIHIEDISRMIIYCMDHGLNGIYNGVSPNALSNYDFTKTLRDVINPKALLVPAPSMAIRLVFGEMSRVVLNSNHVSAQKILNAGFKFSYPALKAALSEIYNR